MRGKWGIGLFLAVVFMSACHTPTREAKRMVKRAYLLADTLPDSTTRLIDSVLRMPASFSERERMDMALLQAEALFGDREDAISPIMDDDFFDDRATLSTSPELERAAAYYSRKKQYAKAAHAALYSGFVQQHYNEKEVAMRSFKEAEQYGRLAVDSLAVAQAEYWMGKMLYDEGREKEALNSIMISENFIGDRYADLASIVNSKAVVYILLGQRDSAEICLQKGLAWAEKAHFEKARRKILNNYAVLYRLQGKYDQAVGCLRQVQQEKDIDANGVFVLNLNLGNVFLDERKMDSAAFYYKRMESLLPTNKIKRETQMAAYDALYKFSLIQKEDSLALLYRKHHEDILYAIMQQRQEQTIYRTQQQYDYESLQNEMNRKLIRKQRLVTIISIFAIIGLTALAVSQIRLARIRKQEAEAKTSLFHFMQQNKALIESNRTQERKVLDTTQQLSDLLSARLMAMQKLDYSLKNPKDKIALKDLEREVFGDGDHWEAVKEVLDALYPGLWETLGLKYPGMDEMERRVYMLSQLKLSRLGEATLLGISTSVLDKIRGKVRKMMEQP